MTAIVPDLASLVQVHLGFGKDRARTLGELAESMGISRRSVEHAIEQMRRDGVPVCTGPAGAWLSTDPTELRQHAERLRARAVTVLLGARALRATARRHERVQQMEMFG